MTIRNAVGVAIRVRRLEKSRSMRVSRQLEALTDPTLLDRMTPKTDTEKGFERMAKVISEAGIKAEDAFKPIKPLTVRQYNQIVYSKRRDIIQ